MLQSWIIRLRPFKGENKREGSWAGPSLCPPPEGSLHTGCAHNASCEAVNGGPGPGPLISLELPNSSGLFTRHLYEKEENPKLSGLSF